MKWNETCVVFVFSAALGWGSTPGMAPASPRLVHDLQAARKGNKVRLTWSQRDLHLVAKVCRNVSSQASAAKSTARCARTVGEIVGQKTARPVVGAAAAKKNIVRFTDTLPDDAIQRDPLQFAVYTIELRDGQRRSAGFSNPVSVPLAPTAPATGLHYELDVRGVYLIWENDVESGPSSLQFDYRVYRSEKGSSHRLAIPYLRALVHIREGNRWSAVDTNIEWGKTYAYWVTPVTRVYSESGKLLAEVEGEDSTALTISTHDVFAPAVPERLLALVSQIPGKKFVDLVWAPNTEKDLASYNIYRREGSATDTVRIHAAGSTLLSFQDMDVASGHTYFYCLSAVDTKGNESPKSSEVAARVP